MPHLLNIVAVTLGVFILLELLIFAARKFTANFTASPLFHGWAILVALFFGLRNTPVAIADGKLWQAICTLLVMASTLVVFYFLDTYILIRPGDSQRRPLMPRLLHDVLRFLLVVASGILGFSYIHGAALPTVLVSSTVVSAVLGLALQNLLKNLFAGVSLELEGLVKVGDWLLLDGQPAQVQALSWRATHLLTNEGVHLITPNVNIAEEGITNYGSGAAPVAFGFLVGLPYETPPSIARKALLSAARNSAGAETHPEPQAFIRSYDDSAILYELRVWTREVHRIAMFKGIVHSKIWYEIQRAGLYVPFPIRTVEMRNSEEEESRQRSREVRRIREMLGQVEIFRHLSAETRDELAQVTRSQHFDDGEQLVREGEMGDSLFIVDRGQVLISKSGQVIGTGTVALATLKPGAVFGELSLLTGDPRSATATADGGCRVLTLSRQDLEPLIAADPSTAETFSQVLARRRSSTQAILEDRQQQPRSKSVEEEDEQTTILHRIRKLFRLPKN